MPSFDLILFCNYYFLATQIVAAHGATAEHESDLSATSPLNKQIQYDLVYVWVAIIVTALAFNLCKILARYVRTLACLKDDTQTFFGIPNKLYAWTKRHILSAALFRTRHSRRIKLCKTLDFGKIPLRLESLSILAYIGTNIALCFVNIDWSRDGTHVAAVFRNRCGVVAVMNLLPLFLLAGRNNPLISLLGINFDCYILIHRWIGRIVVVEALAHGLAWWVPKVQQAGWKAVDSIFANSTFILPGLIGLCALTAILFQSPPIFRHAFYEVFLHVHQALILVAVVEVWVHLNTKELPQLSILIVAVGLWIAERVYRVCTLLYRNISRNGTKADIEVLPGEAVRITLHLARPWTFRPGQHIYLYLPTIGWWTNHPFSLAWGSEMGLSPPTPTASQSRQPSTDKIVHHQTYRIASPHETMAKPLPTVSTIGLNIDDGLRRPTKQTVSLIVRSRSGFTSRLYHAALASPSGKVTVNALVEGPYGRQTLTSYGTVVLFATGVGITHQLPHLPVLLAGRTAGTIATRRIVLVWFIQSPEHLEWVRPWIAEILNMGESEEMLRVLLFVTRPTSAKEISIPSRSVQVFPGKPDLKAVVDREVAESVGACFVGVCGTGSLSDEIRVAVRGCMGRKNVDFGDSQFGW